MAIYEGKWRCPHCAVVNLARYMKCQGCGNTRGKETEFFLEGDEAEVTDESLRQRAAEAPDWLCAYCGGSNSHNTLQCQGCGAGRDGMKFREVREGTDESFRERRAGTVPPPPPPALLASPARTRKGCLPWILIPAAVLALVAVLAVSFIWLITRTTDANLVVDGVTWERVIGIEEHREVTESGWEGELPAGARTISVRREVHHHDRVKTGSHTEQKSYTEQVADGTETYKCGKTSKGNGFFEDKYCTRTKYKTVTKNRTVTVDDYRDVPVYRNRVTYAVWRWMEVDRARASGSDLAPAWPQVPLAGNRREGQRQETYKVFFKDAADPQKRYERAVGPDRFTSFRPGSRWRGKIDLFGRLEDDLQPDEQGGAF